MVQPQYPAPASETLPTIYDLPSEYSKELGLPDEFHDFQPQLLRETCQPPTTAAEDLFISTDLNMYYDSRHPLWHKRPDWFLVLGIKRAETQTDLRLSYVIWQEAVLPFLVVELLSPGTEGDDLGQNWREVNQPPTKWQVYEQVLRVPYYGMFDRYTNDFRLFRLDGGRYQEIALEESRFWFPELELGFGLWDGRYQQTSGRWLRWYNTDGAWIPTLEKVAARERQCADRLANRLRELGIAPTELE